MAALVATGAVSAMEPAEDGEREYPTNQWIVAFHALPSDSFEGGSYQGERIVQVMDDLQFLVVAVRNAPLFQLRVALDENVRFLEWDNPHWATISFIPNDSLYSNSGHWGSKKIGAETAWDKTRGSTSIKVTMVDTGLNKAHQDIARYTQGYDFYNNDSDPNEISACGYHGTHTSGTAGATINNGVGIAGMSQHTIIPARAFGGSSCTGSTTALTNAMRYARDQGAHISSNSWSSSASSSSFNSAIDYAVGGGVMMVAAAGNSGPCSNCVSFPWKDRSSTVTIVSSTTSSDALSSFSSTGSQVDVAAPGSSIIAPTSGTSTYGTKSGTSMATPHVAGTAALIKARNPSWTYSQIDTQLKNTALDLGAAGFDNSFGYGRIRANLAVT